jgi:hypothetical protein
MLLINPHMVVDGGAVAEWMMQTITSPPLRPSPRSATQFYRVAFRKKLPQYI